MENFDKNLAKIIAKKCLNTVRIPYEILYTNHLKIIEINQR